MNMIGPQTDTLYFEMDMQSAHLQNLSSSARTELETNARLFEKALKTHTNVPVVHVAYAVGIESFKKGIGTVAEAPKTTQDLLKKVPFSFVQKLEPSSLVATKGQPSLAKEPTIKIFLANNRNIKTIVLGGVNEGWDNLQGSCLTETAVDLAKMGYDVIIPSEVTNLGLRSKEFHRPLEDRAAYFASLHKNISVKPADEILRDLAQKNGHDPETIPSLFERKVPDSPIRRFTSALSKLGM